MDIRHISSEGLQFIKDWESFCPNAYQCSAGVWTIGYGSTTVKGSPVTQGSTITEQDADAELRTKIVEIERWLHKLLSARLEHVSQPRWDALVSFCYNVGVTAYARSTLHQRILSLQMNPAGGEFKRWVKHKDPKTGELTTSPGLVRRRNAESIIWFYGRYEKP